MNVRSELQSAIFRAGRLSALLALGVCQSAFGQITVAPRRASMPSQGSIVKSIVSGFGNSNFGIPQSYERSGRVPNTAPLAGGRPGTFGMRPNFGSYRRSRRGYVPRPGIGFYDRRRSVRLMTRSRYGWGGGIYRLSEPTRAGSFFSQIDQITFRGWDPLLKRGSNPVERSRARYASWGLPERVSAYPAGGSSGTLPVTGVGRAKTDGQVQHVPPAKMTMRELVEGRLKARRTLFEAQALEAFKAGRYQEACSQLTLADAAAMSDPDQRVYLRLLHVYACIAAAEYIQAANSIYWVLQRSPEDGGSACPAMLNRFRNIRALYGRPGDYLRHGQALDQYVAEHRNWPDTAMLEAMWAWGQGDAVNAKWHARRFADFMDKLLAKRAEAGEKVKFKVHWHRLAELFEEAQRPQPPAGGEAAPTRIPADQGS